MEAINAIHGLAGLFTAPRERMRQKARSNRIQEIAGSFTVEEMGRDLYLTCDGVGLRKFPQETTVGEVMEALRQARREAIGYYSAKYDRDS